MSDILFQIVLTVLGALIGVLGQLLPSKQLKLVALALAIFLIGIGVVLIVAQSGLGLMPNDLAEPEGIIWGATLYRNKELKEPIAYQGQIRGAQNGLRVDWEVGAPLFWLPNDFFSATFTTKRNFLAGQYC